MLKKATRDSTDNNNKAGRPTSGVYSWTAWRTNLNDIILFARLKKEILADLFPLYNNNYHTIQPPFSN